MSPTDAALTGNLAELRELRVRVALLESQRAELVAALRVREANERRYHEFEDRVQVMLEQLPATVWTVDLELRITSSVGEGLRRLNLGPNSTAGRTLFEHFGTRDHEHPVIAMHRRALGGESVRYEGRTGDRPTEVSLEPLRDGEGAVVGCIAVSVDVSERKRVEDALRMTQFAVDRAGQSIFWIDRDGPFVYVNDAACERLGYSRAEMMALTVSDIDPEIDTRARRDERWNRLQELGTWTFESVHRTRSGETFPVEITANYFEYAGKEYNCVFARDISARRKAQESLAAERRKYRDLVENAADMMYALDLNGTLTYVSERLLATLGYRREELIGKWARVIIAECDHDKTERAFAARVRGEIVPPYEMSLLCRDGTTIPVELNSTAVYGPDGAIVGTQTIARDRRRRKRMEELLAAQRHALELIATGAAVDDVLAGVCLAIERLLPGSTCVVRRIDGDGAQIVAAPSLSGERGGDPQDASAAPPGGARGDVVVVHEGGGTARWSVDIRSKQGTRLGIFDVFRRTRGGPSMEERQIMASTAHVASIALERGLAEQRQQLMMRELDHRVKNNLATVLALAEQSAGAAGTLDSFMASFAGRIRSMSLAHEMLARTSWDGVELSDMVDLIVEPHRGDRERLTVSGPPLRLPTSITPSLCLVLHELATNAVKYGALSTPAGQVLLEWRPERDRERIAGLQVRWSERGGPEIKAPPRRPGFGMTLIEGLVVRQLRGRVRLRFDRTGLSCEIDVPLEV